MNELKFQDKTFQLSDGYVQKSEGGTWFLELEFEEQIIDDEAWPPCLYHQGLDLRATSRHELPGISTEWKDLQDSDYPHPEIGLLYIFGHHEVSDSKIVFGPIEGDKIRLSWHGLCAVEYGPKVEISFEGVVEIRE